MAIYSDKPWLGGNCQKLEVRIPVHGHGFVRKAVGDILTEGEQLLLQLLPLRAGIDSAVPEIFEHLDGSQPIFSYDILISLQISVSKRGKCQSNVVNRSRPSILLDFAAEDHGMPAPADRGLSVQLAI